MNEQEVRELFFERLEHLSAEAGFELGHPDYYPNPPTITPRRVVGAGDVWVVEFRDGKIWRDTRYYAEPCEAPAWRARWVEPIEG